MIEIKEVYPYENDTNRVYHYAEDENGKKYFIVQIETGIEYQDAVDSCPCKFTYRATDKEIINEE